MPSKVARELLEGDFSQLESFSDRLLSRRIPPHCGNPAGDLVVSMVPSALREEIERDVCAPVRRFALFTGARKRARLALDALLRCDSFAPARRIRSASAGSRRHVRFDHHEQRTCAGSSRGDARTRHRYAA